MRLVMISIWHRGRYVTAFVRIPASADKVRADYSAITRDVPPGDVVGYK